MKKLVGAVVLGTLVSSPVFAADTALDNDQAKLSYSVGVTLSRSLKQDMDKIDIDALTQGIRDVYADKDLKMDDEAITKTLTDYQKAQIAEQQAEAKKEAAANKKAGESFLAENAKKDGVKTLDSGLQYKVLKEGDGPQPGPNDTVSVDYEGTLIDGTVFDSSYKRGEPVSFQVKQVIKGWQEALQKMHEGGTWMVYVPADLAYGTAGTGGAIGPNQTLIFKVELHKVNPTDQGNTGSDS
ncbi:FKBP-type peptidyl-prolyl cis-trans isomerase [Larsenimonas suaedae]|uniref:Peptidyl-prolyl cis-trans isomerase n=1 Tax=Larsenimonas suaedae TaxID=1851019 RepID=A0ABU1GYG1_9GAMM|nr:FKBP-type peptidyl-prolyl cis-trans isomerase [Larsenimonas suaedae]MCM2973556.1 FKBP-type peptidyl-prolyl cis-trans isomerase [Larsenimonas suaedae]MDR5897074.1 FKBP-type peptidyl-prolyl cis-trans isomerase [Larsenimonas suaedae]